MLNITIDEDFTEVCEKDFLPMLKSNKGFCHFKNITINFFGNALSMLEKEFPNAGNDHAVVINNLTKVISGAEQPKKIWGINEHGGSLHFIYDFIEGRDVIRLSYKDVEELRISCFMTTSPLPKSIINRDEGLCFSGLKSVKEVLIAILYYYAYNGYKLARCKHCRKWFATKTFKEEYCKRISPCYELTVCGEKILRDKTPCLEAVEKIKQRFKDRKKQIYNKWDINGEGDCEELNKNFKEYMERIKVSPTVENICECQKYLYSENMPKKGERRKGTNSFKRGLLGT